MDPGVDDFVALGVLAEPQRARIYAHLLAAREPCTRQQVSDALGIGRTLVAFHLEKLHHAGLVSVIDNAPISGRGRPPQRYAVSDKELIATMPPRRYELLAEVLVRAAAEQTPGEPLRAAALRVARRRGVELTRDEGEFYRRSPAPSIPAGTSRSRSRTEALLNLLTRLGYHPNQDGDALVLTNCPFQRFRPSDTELVCSINAALGAGYLEGLAIDGDVTARLRPCPTNCCVVFEPV